VRLGDPVMEARAHSLVFVPRGTARLTNTGSEPGVVLVGITPGGFEKMFQERQGVDAKTNAELMKAHRMEIVGPKVQ
jgi:quercetin 2,3-dioxygenase